jgi:hypothetical protein
VAALRTHTHWRREKTGIFAMPIGDVFVVPTRDAFVQPLARHRVIRVLLQML